MTQTSVATLTIDCDAPIPEPVRRRLRLANGFDYHEDDQVPSRMRGRISVRASHAVDAFLAEGQQGRGQRSGEEVLSDILRRSAPVYGVAALERLRDEGFIPVALQRRHLFAWGDLFRMRGHDGLFVPALLWRSAAWHWCKYLYGFENVWNASSPAACGIR
ncbi:MAG: hypothetical protein RLZZ324_572 [Candidatus Parcubacteria bacterium]|jgi:hypothetical protein